MFVVRDEGRVRWLTIDNPRRRNAIPSDQWSTLAGVFGDFADSDARVLVVTGAGDDFCSGADLGSDIALGSSADAYRAMAAAGKAAAALHRLPKPTVAAVDGYAVGAGLSLAIGCDLVVATDRARFSAVFVRRGLTVDFGGTWLLPRLVGLARARELALTGRQFGADEAMEYGMLHRVVPADRLAAEVGTLRRTCTLPPASVQYLSGPSADAQVEGPPGRMLSVPVSGSAVTGRSGTGSLP